MWLNHFNQKPTSHRMLYKKVAINWSINASAINPHPIGVRTLFFQCDDSTLFLLFAVESEGSRPENIICPDLLITPTLAEKANNMDPIIPHSKPTWFRASIVIQLAP